jgi:quinol-cytochrome oxidoreductase complex cytochrome b subunit
VRSANYRPLYRQFFWVFVVVCILLGWLGSKPAEGGYVIGARILTAYYFIHFLVILPLLGLLEKTKPLPQSIYDSVLAHPTSAGGKLEGEPMTASGRKS